MSAKREIDLSAGKIEYTDTGSGQPIVFVHGLMASGVLWSQVVPRLEQDFRCIVPDLPLGGHRIPMKPDADLSPRAVARLIAELIEKLDLDGVTIVANDTGGAISQLLVTEHPRADRPARAHAFGRVRGLLPARLPAAAVGVEGAGRPHGGPAADPDQGHPAVPARVRLAVEARHLRRADDGGPQALPHQQGDPPRHRQVRAARSRTRTPWRRPSACATSTGRCCSPGRRRTSTSR